MTRIWLVLFGLALFVWAGPAAAHGRSVSYSSWQLVGQGAEVVVRLSLLDASVLERLGLSRGAGTLAKHVQASLRLTTAAGPCVAGAVRERGGDAEWIDLEWSASCPAGAELTLESSLLFAENPAHLHLAKVVFGDGPPAEHVLGERAPRITLTRASPGESFGRFVLLGVEHIASGWDHLLFLLMLLVGASTLRRTAWVVTGFTLGHGVTLTLAALGVLVPHAAPVEALIALSVALLALENVWLAEGRTRPLLPLGGVLAIGVAAVAAFALGRSSALPVFGVGVFAASYFALLGQSQRPERARAAVATLFGLIHGFGFARVLGEMQLDATRLARGLLGFNLGVELGQIVVVAACWPLLEATRKRLSREWLARAAASGALFFACYWFVTRAFG